MVISDTHRYVFVELPRTGSTAITRELREHYDGRNILHKHATYEEFLKHATEEQRTYYAFAGIRNPLDDAVSLYFKLLSDHKRAYSNLQTAHWLTRVAYAFRARQFRFARGEKSGFSRFFLRFYRWPYDNWSSLSHAKLDCVLRFEHLAPDFERAVSGFGAKIVRPLPLVNKTADRQMHFSQYYNDAAIARAKRVFAVYMQKWEYEFPAEWGSQGTRPGRLNRFVFRTLNVFRRFYWMRLRPALYARTVRERRKRQPSVV